MNTLPLWFSQPWADRLGWTLLHFLWQGAAIALLYALVRSLAITRSPQTRYALACLSLAAMTLAPLATWLWISPAAPPSAGAATTGIAPPLLGPAAASAVASPWEQAIPWIVIAWFTGAAAFSVRLAGGWFSATRLRAAGACPAPPNWQRTLGRLSARMRVTRAVRLLVSTLVDTPTVVGWLRPVILIPAGLLAGLPPDQVEALLLHELAHIRRHDFLVNFLQGVAESVLFYHPAVWWISRQIRIEREHCCDDLAAAASGSVLTYARALAELETARPAHRQTVLAASGGSLAARIRRLIHPAPPHYSVSSAWVLNAVLLSAVGGLAIHAAQDVPRPAAARDATVDRETIWVDTAKQGDLKLEVRALGAVTSATSAELQVAETQAKNLQPGQPVALAFERRKDVVSGKLTNVRPATANGTVPVDVQVAQLPSGIALNARVDGIIVVGGISNVVHVGRPVIAKANTDATIFRLDPDGQHATRVPVHFGQTSVNQIEVKSGLQPGDRVIVSDMTPYQNLDRITLR